MEVALDKGVKVVSASDNGSGGGARYIIWECMEVA